MEERTGRETGKRKILGSLFVEMELDVPMYVVEPSTDRRSLPQNGAETNKQLPSEYDNEIARRLLVEPHVFDRKKHQGELR